MVKTSNVPPHDDGAGFLRAFAAVFGMILKEKKKVLTVNGGEKNLISKNGSGKGYSF